MTTCPCYVCGFPCTDWNYATGHASDHFLNVCRLHNPCCGGDPEGDKENGFQRTSPEGQLIIQMKADYDRLAKEAKVGYSEIACTVCGRMNDVNNPKVKSCWFCTSPVNYDG